MKGWRQERNWRRERVKESRIIEGEEEITGGRNNRRKKKMDRDREWQNSIDPAGKQEDISTISIH